MVDDANREVRFQMRDAKLLFALGDKVFYFLAGMWFSELVFVVTGFHMEINDLVLVFASTVVIGTGWVIFRSLLRRQMAAVAHGETDGNSSPC